jgi:hypothetical protein
MSESLSPPRVSARASGLSPAVAIRIAWVCWLMLLIMPFFFFLYVVWTLSAEVHAAPPPNEQQTWFIASIIYLLVAGPSSFFARSGIFKAYWTGNTVAPGKYLSGMLLIWLALEVGGLFSLAGCLAQKQLLPNLFPALVAFMFFVTFWPSGRAMVRHHVGDQQDASLYEEPR